MKRGYFIKSDDALSLRDRSESTMLRNGSLRFVALVVVVTMPLLGMSGVASAKVKATKGCHKTHTCTSGSGSPVGSGSGTGGAPPAITVQIDPTPLVETGESQVDAVIQVETSPSFAGDPVDISSSQLEAACGGIIGFQSETTAGINNVQLILDDDGNAAVIVEGSNCAPGTSVVDASLEVAPYDTALGTVVAEPPAVTTAGVAGYPTTSGTVTSGEVETGDSATSGDSDVLAVFYVETEPVYAEQPVEINSDQLIDRCGGGALFTTPIGAPTPTTLDDDGNAVFLFFGSSCAAGSSAVIADVEAGSHPTYTTTFDINPPQPTN
jgi:hypothetical protein